MADLTPSTAPTTPAAPNTPADQDAMPRPNLPTAGSLANLQLELTHLGFRGDAEGVQAQLIRGACWMLDCEAAALVLLNEPQDGWIVTKSLSAEANYTGLDLPGHHRFQTTAC